MKNKVIYRSVPDQKKAAMRPAVVRSQGSLAVPSALASFAKGRHFYSKTYGCQANVRDEEVIDGYLALAGFTKVDDPSQADVAVINTCAVRENAEDKIYGEIGTFKANKEKNPSFMLILAGCVMEEEGVAKHLMTSYPFISLIIGTHNISEILSLLNEIIVQKKSIVEVSSFASEVVESLPSLRLNPYEAYVNISYGCDKFCTYCIVPYTRGRERSREEKDILSECANLVARGYKEITLLGQNVNSYGLDLHNGTTFADLLDKVAALGVPRLHFITSYPSQFTDEMIETMARHDNIVKWLHLPVQSGSTSCLRRMGRRYTREEYLSLVKRIRARMPNIALTTDIIVGFPGETEEEFAETLSLCQEVGYSAAFTFIYSARPGTPAAKMPQVPSEVAHERFNRLKAVIEETTGKHSLGMVGHVYQVLVEGPSKKDSSVLSGYAENGKLINFPGPQYLTGSFVPVRVKESHTYSLLGELAEDPVISKAKDVSYLMSIDPVLQEYLRLDKALLNDPSVKALGDNLVAAKKKMALSMGEEAAYKAAKKEYESVLNAIETQPLLHNHDALLDEVEQRLVEVRDALR